MNKEKRKKKQKDKRQNDKGQKYKRTIGQQEKRTTIHKVPKQKNKITKLQEEKRTK